MKTLKEKIVIRQAKSEELPRISYITKLAYRSPFIAGRRVTKAHVPKTLKQDFKDKRIGIFVALISGKIVGAAKYKDQDKGSLYLYQLAVLKGFRGKKIGSLLMSAIEEYAKKKGYNKLTLDCMQEKGLVPYYESKGFKVYEMVAEKDYHIAWMSKPVR